MKVPLVKAPSMKVPSMKAPSVKVPSVKVPSVKVPSVKVPPMEVIHKLGSCFIKKDGGKDMLNKKKTSIVVILMVVGGSFMTFFFKAHRDSSQLMTVNKSKAQAALTKSQKVQPPHPHGSKGSSIVSQLLKSSENKGNPMNKEKQVNLQMTTSPTMSPQKTPSHLSTQGVTYQGGFIQEAAAIKYKAPQVIRRKVTDGGVFGIPLGTP